MLRPILTIKPGSSPEVGGLVGYNTKDLYNCGDYDGIVLPGYEIQLGQSAVAHSKQKLLASSEEIKSFCRSNNNGCAVDSIPCSTEEDSLSYRCKCTFQLLRDSEGIFHYAMRHDNKPLNLGSVIFPIATCRIQQAMKGLMDRVLNTNDTVAAATASMGKERNFDIITRNLTSVTFSSAWYDGDYYNDSHDCIKTSGNYSGDDDDNKNKSNDYPGASNYDNKPCNNDVIKADCIVTLHYGSAIEDPDAWKVAAEFICRILDLKELNGRSRKILVSAHGARSSKHIFDIVELFRGDSSEDCWSVRVIAANTANITQDEAAAEEAQSLTVSKNNVWIRYEKPEGAFFHPNGRVMCTALRWMLNRIQLVIGSMKNGNLCKLLEMYCGCGAHTIALAKAGLLSSILAIEMDQRLVDACIANIKLNNIKTSNESIEGNSNPYRPSFPTETNADKTTSVDVIRSDAQKYAQQLKRYRAKNSAEIETEANFEILLVDPPRMGLDEHVIDMAINCNFEHMLYISCGRLALLRDLKKLTDSYYEVVNCTLLDLFPRTDAIETLVHLQRQKQG